MGLGPGPRPPDGWFADLAGKPPAGLAACHAAVPNRPIGEKCSYKKWLIGSLLQFVADVKFNGVNGVALPLRRHGRTAGRQQATGAKPNP